MPAAHTEKHTAATNVRRFTVRRQSGAGSRTGAGRASGWRANARRIRSITGSPQQSTPSSHGKQRKLLCLLSVLCVDHRTGLRDHGLRRRFDRQNAFDDDGLVSSRRNEVELLRGQPLDSLRRLQRLDLEAQPTGGFLFRRALPLNLLYLVAMAQQLEVLPRGEEQDDHEEAGDADRLPQLALASFVDFADDRVVANVLLHGVLKRLQASPVSRVLRTRLDLAGSERTRPYNL